MKRLAARILSETLYWMGDAVSHPMHWFDSAWLYSVYSWLMLRSSDVQDWAGLDGPWQRVDDIESYIEQLERDESK